MIRGIAVGFIIGGVLFAGGTATAKHLITGKSIAKKTIRSKHIRSSSIANRHLTKGLKRRVNRRGPQGLRGFTGAAGPQGPQGAQGARGPSGVTGITSVNSSEVSIPPGGSGTAEAYCPTGTVVVGTGFFDTITDTGFVKGYTYWVTGVFHNDASITVSVHVQAICAALSPGASAYQSRSDALAERDRDVRSILPKLK